MPQIHSQDLARVATALAGAATQAAPHPALLPRTREIDRLVCSVTASWNGPNTLLQNRRWHRVLYKKPVLLTPLDERTGESSGEPMRAEGHDISLGGISFTHTLPLPFRLIAVSLVRSDGDPESVVTRLTWCRFTRDGVYRSGGQFLRKIENLVSPGDDWDSLPAA